MTERSPPLRQPMWDLGFQLVANRSPGEESTVSQIDVRRTASKDAWQLAFELPPGTSGEINIIGFVMEDQVFQRLHSEIDTLVTDSKRPPLLELFRTPTRREIISIMIKIASRDEYEIHKKDILNQTDASQEALRQNWPPLEQYGLVKPRDRSVPNLSYGLADTKLTCLLKSWDGIALSKLFESRGNARLSLAQFFLFEALPNEWYSRQDIISTDLVGQSAFDSHIDFLIETDLVATQPAKRADREYRINRESEIYTFCHEANAAAQNAYSGK